jgi:putative cell wall-binding protein
MRRLRKAGLTLASASALAALCWCVGVPSAQAAPGPRFGENALVPFQTVGRARDVPGLAVDPANPNHIVEAEADPINLQCDYKVSFDGGRTWAGGHLTVRNLGEIPPFPNPPCDQNFDSGGYAHFNTGIVFGSGQNVYVTFSVHRGAFNRPESNQDGGLGDDAVVARSTDGGRTFAPAVLAVPGGGPVAANPGLAGFGMRPQIAVQRGAGAGGQDRLYVASWNCFIKVRPSQTSRGGCSGGGGDRRIFVTRSNDGGTTWGTPTLASRANVRAGGAAAEAASPDEQAREPSQPVVGPDGTVYVAYRNRDITNGTTCPTNPDAPALTPAPTVPPAPPVVSFPSDSQGCVVVARSPDGTTWAQQSTGQPIVPGTLTNPRLAIDPSTPAGIGTLYVVYQRRVGTDPSDITFQRSTDRGLTWSPPLRVNNDPAGTAIGLVQFNQTNPNVSVGPGGRVDVIWGDKRHTYPGAGNYGDTYIASSTDGGATFGPNRRITDRTTNFDVGRAGDTGSTLSTTGSWYGPVSLSNGGIIASWFDSRLGSFDTGIQDIMLSRLDPGLEIGSRTIATATPPGLSTRLSALAYPGGGEAVTGDPATRVVVANQGDVAGALAGSVLARANLGPLLLSPAGGLPAIVKAESARLRPVGAYVIGDPSSLSATVSSDLRDTTRGGENVSRIAAPTAVALIDRPADIARQIAELLRPLPGGATPEAVIANPATPEAAAAAALAAALRLPILFVDGRNTAGVAPATPALPAPTVAAIRSLGITRLLIVGGTQSVNANQATQLATVPGVTTVTRLDGANQYATSELALTEARTRGLPANVVYVADGARPMDAAVLGAAVSRVTGLMLLVPGASSTAAQTRLTALAVDPFVDRIVAAIGTGGVDPTLPLLPAAQAPAALATTPAALPAAVTAARAAVSSLRLSPSAFGAARSGASVRTAAGTTGTRVTYRLNVAARVRFAVERRSSGRRVGGRCVETTSSNRGRAACVRYLRVSGSFTRTRPAGSDRFTFTGRIAGRSLRAARYRLLVTPTAGGRTGATKRASFRIAG